MTMKQKKAMERNMAKGAVTRAKNFIDALVKRNGALHRTEVFELKVASDRLNSVLKDWEKR